MILAYAPSGLFGLLTPQANTTVEPEFGILTPPGFGFLAARLTSPKPNMNDRLRDYLDRIDQTLTQFANAPIEVVAFACTGASYLLGLPGEALLVERLARETGYRLLTAADAIAAALAALGALKVGLISPYGGSLHEACLSYWQARGLELAEVAQLSGADNAFHPIYGLDAGAAGSGLEKLSKADVEAVIMLGTGLATLPALDRATEGANPVISSNLCLAWYAVQALKGDAPDRGSLVPWLQGEGWSDRLRARVPA
ncbi:MAG: hypothetical protein AAF637_04185 [Pseudomonadota bacterium]